MCIIMWTAGPGNARQVTAIRMKNLTQITALFTEMSAISIKTSKDMVQTVQISQKNSLPTVIKIGELGDQSGSGGVTRRVEFLWIFWQEWGT